MLPASLEAQKRYRPPLKLSTPSASALPIPKKASSSTAFLCSAPSDSQPVSCPKAAGMQRLTLYSPTADARAPLNGRNAEGRHVMQELLEKLASLREYL